MFDQVLIAPLWSSQNMFKINHRITGAAMKPCSTLKNKDPVETRPKPNIPAFQSKAGSWFTKIYKQSKHKMELGFKRALWTLSPTLWKISRFQMPQYWLKMGWIGLLNSWAKVRSSQLRLKVQKHSSRGVL